MRGHRDHFCSSRSLASVSLSEAGGGGQRPSWKSYRRSCHEGQSPVSLEAAHQPWHCVSFQAILSTVNILEARPELAGHPGEPPAQLTPPLLSHGDGRWPPHPASFSRFKNTTSHLQGESFVEDVESGTGSPIVCWTLCWEIEGVGWDVARTTSGLCGNPHSPEPQWSGPWVC